ncbi:MAG: toprim domain-containing protein [Henriciella sp.]
MEARRPPDERRVCPRCSHMRKTAASRAEKVMAVWFNHDGSESHYCHHCQNKAVDRSKRAQSKRMRVTTPTDNSKTAGYLWRCGRPTLGTPVEPYIWRGRGIGTRISNTIRYLPARNAYPHAMVTAFGVAQEVEPGVLQPPEDVRAIHITRLAPDGLSRLDKRMLGPVGGLPLVLAPPNDGLGLVITEGVEDALSMHAATGLGTWAAGSASHMARLAPAVPGYIEHVLIIADDDEAGLKNGHALAAELLARRFDVTVKTLRRDGCHG